VFWRTHTSIFYTVGRKGVCVCLCAGVSDFVFAGTRCIESRVEFIPVGKDYYHPKTRYQPARRHEVIAYRSLLSWGSLIPHVKFWISRHLHRIAKSDYLLRHICQSVRPSVCRICPHGTTRRNLDGFWLNLIFEYFFENLSRKFKFH
jgi:hypothetical protein